ncbi:MAG TPA: hypothetical protein VF451_00395, partial [Acidobacteriota bacterium]
MRNMQRAWVMTIVMLAVFLGAGWPAFAGQTSRDTLAGLEKALDARLLNWEQSPDGGRWEAYKPGHAVEAANFRLRTALKAPVVFAATTVQGTPLRLKVSLRARGLAVASFFLDGRELEQATVHGEGGTETEWSGDIVLGEQADDREHRLEIVVENKGFVPARTGYWPERRRGAPADEGSWVALNAAELRFPAAANNLAALQEWLRAFQFADILLNPELKRYTFTGRPYDIPDKRRVPGDRLARLNAAFDRAVAALDLPALAAGGWPRVRSS